MFDRTKTGKATRKKKITAVSFLFFNFTNLSTLFASDCVCSMCVCVRRTIRAPDRKINNIIYIRNCRENFNWNPHTDTKMITVSWRMEKFLILKTILNRCECTSQINDDVNSLNQYRNGMQITRNFTEFTMCACLLVSNYYLSAGVFVACVFL